MMLRKSQKSAENTPGKTRLGSRERRLLSETAQIEEEVVPSFVRPLLSVAAVTVLAFLFWASVTEITEVARAPGEILPVGKIKVVQHMDGGVVSEIAVQERSLVQAGQVLLKIDGAQANADLAQIEARRVALSLRAERLEAFAAGRQPQFVEPANGRRQLLSGQQDTYRAQLAARDSTTSILDRQIEQRARRLMQLDEALRAARDQQKITGELTSMREDLAARRLVNRTVLLETKRAQITADGEVARISEEINVVRQELGEFRNRRADTLNQLQREAFAELGSVRAEMAEVEESILRLQARVDRLVIKAPYRGYIQDLKVQTVGQVVQPGAILMQIVPDDAPLEAEVRISPQDIGHVRTGQQVNMRVSSYDYTRFGYATGKLQRISASSVTAEDGRDNKTYYRAWASLDHPYVGSQPGRYPVQAGMSLEAEVITGKKTLMAYLTKPLVDSVSRSFHER
ncbi:MAG: HlyD family type I secretion periplasmic adaptor subunit [Azonexus sp.]|nr:HlyD family type I secretion periplasmic adaptor subunit [Azonexus sp.]MCK6413627.1 HlyD family type I secretion periplasmic adaptor subunit [Azonexus sp.]